MEIQSNITQVIDSYEWFIDGVIVPGATWNLTTSLADGTYQIKLVVGSNAPFSCFDTAECIITVQSNPQANFSIGPDSSCLGNGPTLFLDNSNNGSGGQINYWEWNFGSTNIPPFANPGTSCCVNTSELVTFGSNGNWAVDLIVEDQMGCRDTVTDACINVL